MKKSLSTFLSFCLATILVFSAAPSLTNAQTIVNDPNQTIFTDSFINIVEEFIEISDKEFKITNKLALRKKITSEEFIALEEQIELMNSQIREFGKDNLVVENQALVSYGEFEEVNGDIITTFASPKEGITKWEWKIWGYKVWLSRSDVEKILRIGSVAGGTGIGSLGGVPGAVGGAIAGGILAEFASPAAARAMYFEVVYPIIVMKAEFQ